MGKRLAAAISALFLTQACTTTQLQSGKINPTPGRITQGVSYQLPELVYAADITRTVSDCPPAESPKSVQFDITAKAASSIVAGEPVVIDYANLANWMKTTDFSLELYPSGVLKSVNATIDDRTAAVATEAFKAAASIAKIAIGLPTVGPVPGISPSGTPQLPPPPTSYIACTETASAALQSLSKLRSAAQAAEADSKKAAKAASDFAAANKDKIDSDPALTARLKELTDAAEEAHDNLDAANKALSATVSAITLISHVEFAPQGQLWSVTNKLAEARDGKSKPEGVLELRFKLGSHPWIGIPLSQQFGPDRPNAHWVGSGDGENAASIASQITDAEVTELMNKLDDATVIIASAPLYRQPEATGALADASSCPEIRKSMFSANSVCGILYRTRTLGRTRICSRSDEESLPSAEQCQRLPGDSKLLLFTEDKAIPQLGALMSLPLKNGPLANNSLSAEFAEDGGLIKFGYKKPTAQGEAALQTVNSGLGSLTDVITYANGSELRSLQEQKTLAEAQLAAANAKKALQPSEVTQVDNEASLLQAQIDKTQKQIDLIKKQQELEALLQATETSH